jgi:hypothetical protein
MATRTRTSSTTTTTTSYKPAIRYRGGTRYDVQSRTRPDHVHAVDTYRLTCTCEAGRWGKRCWAMAAALQFEAWRKHELAKAQAAASAARPSGMAALQDAFA